MAIFSLSEKDLSRLLKPKLSSPLVFLETASFDKENKTSFLFSDFTKILTFNSNSSPELFFTEIEDLLSRGFWLAGYFSYEFGYFLEPALSALSARNNEPLAWLGVCKKPLVINHKHYQPDFKDRKLSFSAKNIKPNITLQEYCSQIRKIKTFIEEGLTYQVNFTFKIKFDFTGEALDLYLNLRRAQPTPYSAFINTGDKFILSLSPELFFRRQGKRIVTRPMKGTFSRGLTSSHDRENEEWLRGNRKNKAENLMIVDLLRNDLGRIAEKVRVAKLFNIEKYATLFQMTSTVEAELRNSTRIKDIFTSLFPSGSVTGAPKIKTMQIIKSLEKGERGIYTGAIGYISPHKQACFNVAIRTIALKSGKAEMGVGGGIVYDSKERDEFDEALLKAKFLMERFPAFSLIETILWEENKGYFFLGLHLKRLKNSCDYFSSPLDIGKLKQELRNLGKSLSNGKWKFRVLLDLQGRINIEREPLREIKIPLKVKISQERINPRNAFLYHKTTQRDLYDREKNKAEKEGFSETVFLNTKEELTEGAFTNIFVQKNGSLYTPPVKCGLLPGVLREYLLKAGKAKEKVLHLRDILKADKFYMGNSVRGLLEARVVSKR